MGKMTPRLLIAGLAMFIFLDLSNPALAEVIYPKEPSHLKYQASTCGATGKDFCPRDIDIRATGKRDYIGVDARGTIEVKMLKYIDTRSGQAVWGLQYESKRKEQRKKNDKVWVDWLLDPEWADIEIWDGDFAFGLKPGETGWTRIDLVRGREESLGNAVIGRTYEIDRFSNVRPKGVPTAYLATPGDDGLATIQFIGKDGRPYGATLDRVILPADMPTGRHPVEIFEDGTLLVHRVDANGKVFDQVFEPDMSRALTPPLPPLLIVEIERKYLADAQLVLLEIDESRRLFWPVAQGRDIFAKPGDLIGVRPLTRPVDGQLRPVPAQELAGLYSAYQGGNPKYAGAFRKCVAGQPNCDISAEWVAVWQTDNGARLAPIGSTRLDTKTSGYNTPKYEDFALSQDRAEYVSFKPAGPVPQDQAISTYGIVRKYGYYMRDVTSLYVAGRADGQFDLIGYGMNPVNLEHQAINLAPLASESAARAYIQTAVNNTRAHAQRVARQEAITEAQRAKEKAEEERRRMLADTSRLSAREQYDLAVSQGQYGLALDCAWRLTQRDVYNATMAALRDGYGNQVTRSDLRAASQSASPQDMALINSRANELNRLEAAAYGSQNSGYAYKGASISNYSSGGVSSGSQSVGSVMNEARWQSQMQYLSGATSSYMCGGASFCK